MTMISHPELPDFVVATLSLMISFEGLPDFNLARLAPWSRVWVLGVAAATDATKSIV